MRRSWFGYFVAGILLPFAIVAAITGHPWWALINVVLACTNFAIAVSEDRERAR